MVLSFIHGFSVTSTSSSKHGTLLRAKNDKKDRVTSWREEVERKGIALRPCDRPQTNSIDSRGGGLKQGPHLYAPLAPGYTFPPPHFSGYPIPCLLLITASQDFSFIV